MARPVSRSPGACTTVGLAFAAALVSAVGFGNGAETGLASEPALVERPAEGLDESVWMALAGEPRFHLLAARTALEEHRLEDVASHLRAVEGVMRLEATRALGVHESQRLEGAALAIGEAGRQARAGTLGREELRMITARGLLAVAEHHRSLAVAAFRAHRSALGGIHTAEVETAPRLPRSGRTARWRRSVTRQSGWRTRWGHAVGKLHRHA